MVSGLLLCCAAFALLTRLQPDSGYATYIVPSLVIIGLGLGAVVPPAMDTATRGVDFKRRRSGLSDGKHDAADQAASARSSERTSWARPPIGLQ
jgi:hypothetical protein